MTHRTWRLSLSVALLFGCTHAAVSTLVEQMSGTQTFLDLVTVAVQLTSPEHADNDAAYATLQERYDVDVKASVDGLTDAAKALINTAKTVRDEIAAGRSLSDDERDLLRDLRRILPAEDALSPAEAVE